MKKFKKLLFSIVAFAFVLPIVFLATACGGSMFNSADKLKYNEEHEYYYSSDLEIKKDNVFVFKIKITWILNF